jgi:hypothetical protein
MKEDTATEFCKKRDAETYAKWEKTGLMRGIDDPDLQRKVSTLLENQAKYILQDTKSWAKEIEENKDYQLAISIVFPMIRRIFADPDFNTNVDWDVMTMPAGLFEGKTWMASTEKLATRFDAKLPFEPGGYLNLDPEIEMISILTEKLAAELQAKWAGRKVRIYIPVVMMGKMHFSDIGTDHQKYGLATRFAYQWKTGETDEL